MKIETIVLKGLYAELNVSGITSGKLYNKLPEISKIIAHSITEDIKKNLFTTVCKLIINDKDN